MIYNEKSKTKSKKPKNPFQVDFFMLFFLFFRLGFLVGFFGANPGKNLKSLSKDVTILFFLYSVLCAFNSILLFITSQP